MRAAIHWNKHIRQWSVHTYKGCSFAPAVIVRGFWSTFIKPHAKSNPRAWVIADHKQVELLAEIPDLQVMEKLVYDKDSMKFNISCGYNLIFLPHGAYMIEEDILERFGEHESYYLLERTV